MIAASVAAVLLAALATSVSDQRFLLGEVAVLEAANGFPAVVGWPLRVVMQLGTIYAALALVALLAWRADRAAVLALALSTAVAFRLDNVLKDLIDRPRPPGLVDGLDVRESIHGYGFPSGHTTLAFALAAALHPVLDGAWRWLAWSLAVLVGVARMHVGVHWPADVVGGALLGTAIGSLAWLVSGALVRPRAPA
ncbi:MAG TPA: phosphatase PAP2 family protein [Acidimicrobiales bacterium]